MKYRFISLLAPFVVIASLIIVALYTKKDFDEARAGGISNYEQLRNRAFKAIPLNTTPPQPIGYNLIGLKNITAVGADVLLYDFATTKTCFGRVVFNKTQPDSLQVGACTDEHPPF